MELFTEVDVSDVGNAVGSGGGSAAEIADKF